jgi:hypothetical protein
MVLVGLLGDASIASYTAAKLAASVSIDILLQMSAATVYTAHTCYSMLAVLSLLTNSWPAAWQLFNINGAGLGTGMTRSVLLSMSVCILYCR